MHVVSILLSLALTATALPIESRQTSLSGKSLVVLPLGDSITWGYADPSNNGYRSPLYNSLVSAGAKVDMVGSVKNGNMKDPDNEGHPGWTVSQIAGATTAIKGKYNPNVILLHAGTNDANGSDNPSAAPQKIANLIDQLSSQWPKATLLVARIVPSTNANTQKNINNINSQISSKSF
jgi:lysophospholipase L1-like esterase